MSSRITADNINLGNGVLEIGTYDTSNQFQSYTDLGAVKGTATLTYMRETNRFESGRPMVVLKEEIIRESVELRIALAELTVANLKLVLNGGVVSSSVSAPTFLTGNGYALLGGNAAGSSSMGLSNQFEFGGDPAINPVALRFTHMKNPVNGKRQVIEAYKAVFTGQLALPFNETDWNVFEATFQVVADTTKAAGKQLIKWVDEI